MAAQPAPERAPVRGRAITLTREGSVFRLAFGFNRDLLTMVKNLPFAAFDPQTKSWTTRVCQQSVQQLRRMYHQGLTDVGVDALLGDGEDVPAAREAVLRAGTPRRPYLVHLATRGSTHFTTLRAIPGAVWEKKAGALSYPPAAAAALAELTDRGLLDDPDNLLAPAEVTISFDGRTGLFAVRGNPRAAQVFATSFPATDVYGAWRDKGLDVAFLDPFTEQMYRGELARHSGGFQPAGLQVDLFAYQKQSVALALEREGLGVLHAPGLGKTIIGIATGLELLNRGAVTRVVAVVPAAVRTQWKNEIVKFTGVSDDQISVVRGDPAAREAAYERATKVPWVIVHYDVLSRDLEALRAVFSGAFVIADEVHRVKHFTSARTRALKELTKHSVRRMGLSGTPLEREPSEWYEVLSGFCLPGCLGTATDYLSRYTYEGTFGGRTGARNLHELRERSRPFYIRFTKEQVAKHLPPMQVQTQILDPDPAYAAALKRAHAEAAKEIKAKALGRLAARTGADQQQSPSRTGSGEDLVLLDESELEEVETGANMTASLMLRLLSSSPRLIQASDSPAAATLLQAGLIPDEDGPKMDELRTTAAELLATQERRKVAMADAGIQDATPEMVRDERVVIFTFSKRMANLIAARFTEDGVPHVMFTGDTSGDDRDDAVAAFTDPNSDVIAFIATDAAAEGLNLGRCCGTVIEVEPATLPTRSRQRRDRVHRVDSTGRTFQAIQLVLAGTIEHGIVQLAESRADMADTILGESGGRARATGRKTRTRAPNLFEQALKAMRIAVPDEPVMPGGPRPGRGKTASRSADSGTVPSDAPASPAGQVSHVGSAQEIDADDNGQLMLL